MSLQLVIGRCVGRLGALVEAATEREGLKTPSDEKLGILLLRVYFTHVLQGTLGPCSP